jgi:hypothetical protein
MNKEEFAAIIVDRLDAVYTAWQQGKDVAPVVLFRLEGIIESACLLGFLTLPQANELIASAWHKHSELPLPALSEQDIQIPSAMQRAPVYPSTSEASTS